MNDKVIILDEIHIVLKPLVKKYKIEKIYIFGSYARKEADEKSDLDLLVYGGKEFRPVSIFSFAEDVRKMTSKDVDAYEISEINQDSIFYNEIM